MTTLAILLDYLRENWQPRFSGFTITQEHPHQLELLLQNKKGWQTMVRITDQEGPFWAIEFLVLVHAGDKLVELADPTSVLQLQSVFQRAAEFHRDHYKALLKEADGDR